MYPPSGWEVESTKKRLNEKIQKVCQEVARYVLPIAQLTVYDHTLSELQLLRLFRASRLNNFSDEARFIIGSMVGELAKADPTILKELDTPAESMDKISFNQQSILERKAEFDAVLGEKMTLLRPFSPDGRLILSDAVRNVLALPRTILPDEESLKVIMDPEVNRLLADVYEVGMHDPLTGSLRQLGLTFYTRLSHTADSQRQRQRRTPGATPALEAMYGGIPDYQTPLVVKENEALKNQYDEIMSGIYGNVETALKIGIPTEYALLLLPNAQTVRVVESGDLFDWLHRWKQRLCFLAQEEICFISIEQVEQLGKVLPQAKNMLLALCGIRQKAGVKPRCPEGNRWCGKPVYNWAIDKYKKNRLI